MQQLFGRASATLRAIAADLKPGHDNVEAAVALDLTLEAIEEVAFKFQDLSTAETCHVDVVALGASFIEVLLPLHMHQVEFVH